MKDNSSQALNDIKEKLTQFSDLLMKKLSNPNLTIDLKLSDLSGYICQSLVGTSSDFSIA